MGVTVTLWDIPGGDRKLVLGTFESVQLTGIDVVRDQDGDIIAERRAGNEWSPYADDFHAPVDFYSDITFEAEEILNPDDIEPPDTLCPECGEVWGPGGRPCEHLPAGQPS